MFCTRSLNFYVYLCCKFLCLTHNNGDSMRHRSKLLNEPQVHFTFSFFRHIGKGLKTTQQSTKPLSSSQWSQQMSFWTQADVSVFERTREQTANNNVLQKYLTELSESFMNVYKTVLCRGASISVGTQTISMSNSLSVFCSGSLSLSEMCAQMKCGYRVCKRWWVLYSGRGLMYQMK